MSPEKLREKLCAAFADARVTVTDLTGTENHYQVEIVSPDFDGKSRIQRHKMVYAVLGDSIGGEIHALTLSTETPKAG